MKKILFTLIAAIFFTVNSNSQNAQIQEIVQTTLDKNTMWTNAKLWISQKFSSYESAVDMEDKDNGILVIKMKNPFQVKDIRFVQMAYSCDIKLEIKDNKYRYTIYNQEVIPSPSVNTKDMSYDELRTAEKELQFIVDFSSEYYLSNDGKWKMDSDFEKLVSEYKYKLDSTEKFKNKKKTKISEDWVSANINYTMLSGVWDAYNDINLYLIKSIKENMGITNDF